MKNLSNIVNRFELRIIIRKFDFIKPRTYKKNTDETKKSKMR